MITPDTEPAPDCPGSEIEVVKLPAKYLTSEQIEKLKKLIVEQQVKLYGNQGQANEGSS